VLTHKGDDRRKVSVLPDGNGLSGWECNARPTLMRPRLSGLPHGPAAYLRPKRDRLRGGAGPRESRRGSARSPRGRIALGQTEAVRYLRVVYVPDPEPDSVFVSTAHTLEGKPLTAYKRRRRRPQVHPDPAEPDADVLDVPRATDEVADIFEELHMRIAAEPHVAPRHLRAKGGSIAQAAGRSHPIAGGA